MYFHTIHLSSFPATRLWYWQLEGEWAEDFQTIHRNTISHSAAVSAIILTVKNGSSSFKKRPTTTWRSWAKCYCRYNLSVGIQFDLMITYPEKSFFLDFFLNFVLFMFFFSFVLPVLCSFANPPVWEKHYRPKEFIYVGHNILNHELYHHKPTFPTAVILDFWT